MKLFKDFGVRALMAAIAITGAVVALVWRVITAGDTVAMQMLGDTLLAIMAFYFGMRAGQNGQNARNTG